MFYADVLHLYVHTNMKHVSPARIFTARVKTPADDADAGTDSDIYLTMFDANENSCDETLLDNGQDVLEPGA